MINIKHLLMCSMLFDTILPNQKASIKCSFNNESFVKEIYRLKDFSNHEFRLYEMENSYAIYLIDGENEIFMEGSKNYNSPFYNLEFENLYYLGPGNYYGNADNSLIDLLTQEKVDESIMKNAEINLNNEKKEEIKLMSANVNADNSTVSKVKYSKLFSNLSHFPMNWFGECGLVALSIYLGYLDTVYNDDIVGNSREYYSYTYDKSDGRTEQEKLTPVTVKKENLMYKPTIAFKGDASYDANSWESVPGPNYSFRDLLFNKYKHTVLNIGNSEGFPMLDVELMNTFKDYIRGECSSLIDKFTIYSGNVTNSHVSNSVKNLLNKGIPVCTVLKSFTYTNRETTETRTDHDVVIYGYQGDKLIAHMGWGPGTLVHSENYISNMFLYGYFAAEYKGEHKHSKNVSLNHYTGQVKVCADAYMSSN